MTTSQEQNWQTIFGEASHKAKGAAEKVTPTPVGFYQADLAGNKIGETMICDGGLCGLAWVKIYADGRSAFGKWLKDYEGSAGRILKNYGGRGFQVWCPLNTQSVEIKEVWAETFASYLKEEIPSIKAYAGSRLI